jgi:hypothetical protein
MGSSVPNYETSLYELLTGTLPFVRAGTACVDIEFVLFISSRCISEDIVVFSLVLCYCGHLR